MIDGPYKGLRGFGSVFYAGGVRNWYVDSDGYKRFSDNDKLVEGGPTHLTPLPPPPKTEGE